MKFKLPKQIGPHTHFTWGPVVEVHEIGNYSIVEYKSQIFENNRGTGKYSDETLFHPYVNGEDSNSSCETLDVALIECIAAAKLGFAEAFNSRSVNHVARLLYLD